MTTGASNDWAFDGGKSLSREAAEVLLRGGLEYADREGGAFCIAVVDSGGNLKAFARMDGAPLLAIQVAQDKAYTAVGFGMPTSGWYDFIKDDPPLALGAPSGIDRLVVFGGGIPVVVDGNLIGGVGVSGGHYSQDANVAQAAIDSLLARG